MKLPFTVAQFLALFKDYNSAIWPLQFFFYALALATILVAIRKAANSSRIILYALSFFWLWMGVVYHLAFFSRINKAAYIFGAFFIVQAILFLSRGASKRRLLFHFQLDSSGIAGMVLILYALIIYPVLGYFQGHVYPASPTFGAPCPTTIFTFGLLLWTDKKIPWLILVIPLAWAAIGSSAAFALGIREDTGLLIAALTIVVFTGFRNTGLKKMRAL